MGAAAVSVRTCQSWNCHIARCFPSPSCLGLSFDRSDRGDLALALLCNVDRCCCSQMLVASVVNVVFCAVSCSAVYAARHRVEMMGGALGQGTELAAMNLCNTRTRSKHNLCMLGRFLSVLRMYHKSGGLTGHDKLIPHALDRLTSDLLIQDLVLARLFACMAAKMCFPDQPEIHQLYQERLFVNNGQEFETSDLTSTICQLTFPHVGLVWV